MASNKDVDQTEWKFGLHHVGIQRGGGGRGSASPWKITKNIVFLSNTGPDPLKITKLAASKLSMLGHLMAFLWRADDGLLIMVFGSSLPST